MINACVQYTTTGIHFFYIYLLVEYLNCSLYNVNSVENKIRIFN